MWLFLCIIGLMSLSETRASSLADIMAETTQRCCKKGLEYGYSNPTQDCSSSHPPDVSSTYGSLCIYAMDQCCKEFFTTKRSCDAGIAQALNNGQCTDDKDINKNCCLECLRGIGERSLSKAACNSTLDSIATDFIAFDGGAAELLAVDAFKHCCMAPVEKPKFKENSGTTTKPPSTAIQFYAAKPYEGSKMVSLCEEYAPHELCAHHCIPVPNSYKCTCDPGFRLMADGKNCIRSETNRCKPRNPCEHKCNDDGEKVRCSCRRGYRLKADGVSCEDIDECKLDYPPCLANTECYNIQGSYKCLPKKNPEVSKKKGQCPPGFIRNELNDVCDDVNECTQLHPPCPAYLCENTIGGYKCGGALGDPANLIPGNAEPVANDRCPQGFRAGFNQECEDVDECALHQDDCNPLSQFCINTQGSFHCQNKASKHCPPGFKIDPMTNKCEDINECEYSQDICNANEICVNVPGEYDCKPKDEYRKRLAIKCPDGMRMKPDSMTCEDIDECAEGTHICDLHQNCLNTNGSHECRCKLGFEIDPITGSCMDVNECATDTHNCIPGSQRCDNTVGSFICVRFTSCGTGYILQSATGHCEDIDECAVGTHNCAYAGPDWHCENHPGSFRCVRNKPSTTSTTAAPEYDEYYSYDDDGDTKETTITTPKPTEPPTTLEKESMEPNPPEIDPRFAKPDPEPQRPEESKTTEQPEPQTTSTLAGKKELEEELPKSFTNYYNVFHSEDNELDPKGIVKPTPPQVVEVKVGHETATVQGEKKEDGSLVVDTENIPKNEWTKVVEKPVIYCKDGFYMDDFGKCVETRNVAKTEDTKDDDKSNGGCEPGFFMDNHGQCEDIDECATKNHTCSGLTEVCRNTMGGYLCDCAPGFRRDLNTGACDVFVFSSNSTTSSTTTGPVTLPSGETEPQPSSAERRYFWGYPDYRPVTTRPFRPRNMCDVGYHLNTHTLKCEDINECTNGQANCAAVEICVNTEGGYRCECPPNWKLDSLRHRCVPQRGSGFPSGYGNEPGYQPPTPSDVRQTFKGNQYVNPAVTKLENDRSVITCPAGYKLGYNNDCEDIDECETGQANCGSMLCTNLRGGYVCSCPQGHKLVDNNRCEDVDECVLGGNMPVCSQNADCHNTVGSYQCKCHAGFRSAPVNDKVCVDVDECTESPSGSLCQHRCNNLWGGYRCSCYRGYRVGADNSTCEDVDECREYKQKILCVGRCVNEPGSYRCTCPDGYRLSEDKRSCIDIDECETGLAPCANGGHTSAGSSDVCFNTRGGYRCLKVACPPGYRLESRHRCTLIEKSCPPADWDCAHQPTTISYNFITFVSNLYIPAAKVELFTMRGPAWPNGIMRFNLKLVKVDAPPSVKEKADSKAFLLAPTGNQAVVSLVRSLEGPQSIELELSMESYYGEQFSGTAVAKIYIFVTEFEF